MRLLVGVTLFFIACIEVFALAVSAHVPYVGVAFFIWVGIFSVSLVAQFWSFANDIYSEEAGERLFPIIVIGMTAGAPLGSLIASLVVLLNVVNTTGEYVVARLLTTHVNDLIWTSGI